MIRLAAIIAIAVPVGVVFGWRWVFAPLFGWAIYSWATSSLRAMVTDGRALTAAQDTGPTPVLADERIVYWCEECGTEVVLVIRGSGTPPRHCGTKMHERAELLSN
jgi:hypothetical protein